MKRAPVALLFASAAAAVVAHPHFNKTVTAKLPSGADVTITYNTVPVERDPRPRTRRSASSCPRAARSSSSRRR